MAGAYIPAMTFAQLLWDSVAWDNVSTLVYSDVSIVGFEPQNAFDWRDFSTFRCVAGTQTVDFTLPSGGTVDTVCAWPVAGASNGATVQAFWYNGSAWAALGPPLTPDGSGNIIWQDFASTVIPAGGKVRFQIVGTGTSDWRQLSVGPKMIFPIGQWSGVSPPQLYQGVVLENVMSVNGSILGRNVRRLEKKGVLSLNYLQPDWIRNVWNPFTINAARRPFWWRWNPAEYPQEVAFAAASEIQPPTNDRPAPMMKVDMPILFLT